MKHIMLTFALANLLLAGCASTSPSTGERNENRLHDHPAFQVEELFKGSPGVDVIRRGQGFEIRIRGSLREPLYIIDGMRLTPEPGGGTLLGINPYDIEKIKVLTNPVDISYYGGSLGADGVVLITTKRGR